MHRTVNRVIFNLQIKLNWVATTANFCCSMLMLFLLKFELLEVILNIEALLLLYSWWIELCDSELFSEFSNRFWWNSIFCPSEIHCEGLFSFRRLREDKHFQNWMFTSVSFHGFFIQHSNVGSSNGIQSSFGCKKELHSNLKRKIEKKLKQN